MREALAYFSNIMCARNSCKLCVCVCVCALIVTRLAGIVAKRGSDCAHPSCAEHMSGFYYVQSVCVFAGFLMTTQSSKDLQTRAAAHRARCSAIASRDPQTQEVNDMSLRLRHTHTQRRTVRVQLHFQITGIMNILMHHRHHTCDLHTIVLRTVCGARSELYFTVWR